MAAANTPVQELWEELKCSICLDYFRDPVTVAECGHNFYRACLSQCSGESDTEATCPQCRGGFQKSNLRPNRQLANVVEIAKKLGGQTVKGAEGKVQLCEKHQEPLKLFCRDHEAPICLVCDKAKEHEGHKVVPLEEASQEYQDLLHHRLEILRKEREKVLAYKADTERENQELLKETKAVREETVAQFRRMHQFLEEQEKRLLAQVDELQEEIARKADDHLAKLSKELSSLEGIMREVEEKSWQPAAELLQDVRSTLQRSEKEPCEIPAAFPPELKWRIWDLWDINHLLEGVRMKFQGALLHGLQLHKANVTLDPDTVNPKLILSEDRKSVRRADQSHDLTTKLDGSTDFPVVLGREGFRRGRHFWEVNVECGEEWIVGVIQSSRRRKGEVTLPPKEEFWAMGFFKGEYSTSASHSLSLSRKLKKIRVSLNCSGGRVAFYDADQGTLLHAFSGVPCAGGPLFPFFEANIRISS